MEDSSVAGVLPGAVLGLDLLIEVLVLKPGAAPPGGVEEVDVNIPIYP